MSEQSGLMRWVGGAVVLATTPLAVFAVMMRGEPENRFEGFQEGGAYAWAVVGLALFGSLVAAVLLGLSGKRPALLPLAVASFVPSIAMALLGLVAEQAEAREAIEHASQADHLTLLAGAISEGTNLGLITRIVCGVAFGLVGLGSLFTLAHAPRAPRVFTGLTSGLFGLASFGFAFHSLGVINSFRAVAHASPADRGHILDLSFVELEPRHLFALGLLGIATVLGLAGGVVVMRTARLAGALLLVCVALTAGATWALDRRALATFEPSSIQPWLGDVFNVVGGPGDAWDALSVVGEEAQAALDETIDGHAARNASRHRVSVMAQQSLTTPLLRRVMVRAVRKGAHLELVGRGKPEPVASPEWSRRFVELLSERASAARLELRSTDGCEGCGGSATFEGEQLAVVLADAAPAKWSLAEDPHMTVADSEDWKPLQLDFAWDGRVEHLVKAASIAFTHGAVLNVVAKEP